MVVPSNPQKPKVIIKNKPAYYAGAVLVWVGVISAIIILNDSSDYLNFNHKYALSSLACVFTGLLIFNWSRKIENFYYEPSNILRLEKGTSQFVPNKNNYDLLWDLSDSDLKKLYPLVSEDDWFTVTRVMPNDFLLRMQDIYSNELRVRVVMSKGKPEPTAMDKIYAAEERIGAQIIKMKTKSPVS